MNSQRLGNSGNNKESAGANMINKVIIKSLLFAVCNCSKLSLLLKKLLIVLVEEQHQHFKVNFTFYLLCLA